MEEMSASDSKLNNGVSYRSLFGLLWKLTCMVIKTKRFLARVLLLILTVAALLYLRIWEFSHVPWKESDGSIAVARSDWNTRHFLKLADEERINYIRRLAPANVHDSSAPLNDTTDDWTNLILEILDNWNVSSSQSRPMNLAVQFYSQCQNESYIRKEAVFKILNSLGGWPSINPDWTEDESDFLYYTAKARRLYAHAPFFIVFVYIHEKNTSANIINLNAPEFFVSAEMFSGTDANNDTASVAYIDSYANSARYLSGLDDPEFEYEATEVYNLERKLAIAGSPESNTEPDQVMTLDEFQLKMNKVNVTASHTQVNWTHLLNDIFRTSGVTVKPSQEIIVRNMNFMRKLPEILETTALRTLVNYMQWSLVRKWFPGFSKKFDTSVNFTTSALGIDGEDHETAGAGLKNRCLTDAMHFFALPLCNEFVRRQYYFLPAARGAVDKMTTTMRESFMEIIRENSWASDVTKINALKKVAGMKQFVGYPDWLKNGTKLDERFGKLQLGNNRVETMANIVHWESDRNFNSLNWDAVAVRDLWSRPVLTTTTGASLMPAGIQNAVGSVSASLKQNTPLDVNAYYLGSLNSIVVPMGIFYFSFYSQNRPAYVNFGKLGWIIGHEIAHGFDTTGNLMVDAEQVGLEWFSPEDNETFEGHSKCFVEQYSQYELFPGKRVNGTLTLDENIADNLGLQLAYRAHKRVVQDEELREPKKLLGLEKLSPDQLFFLSYASAQCEKMASPATLVRRLLYDNHSPNRFRAIGTLQNSKEFAQAWHCPAGSSMNPKTKCNWW